MQRFFPLSEHYRRRFGCKVYKVGVSVAQTCPNRKGLKGMSVCVFCDEWGSAAYPSEATLPLGEQIRVNRERIRRRYRAEKFLVYFQAYTNTFERITRLEHWLHEALAEDDVVGVVLGTRPDCLSPTVLKLLDRVSRRAFVSVEVGVQSLDDAQLDFLARGHDAAASLSALERLARWPGIESCAHLIFGLPGETDAQLADTARVLSALGVQGVKLHNLHVLAGTPLQGLYDEGGFRPVSLEAYAHKVRVFLEHLAPHVPVHRLNAVASRWEEVVAPDWAREKLRPTQHILDHLARHDSWQGKYHARVSGPLPARPPASGGEAEPPPATQSEQWA